MPSDIRNSEANEIEKNKSEEAGLDNIGLEDALAKPLLTWLLGSMNN